MIEKIVSRVVLASVMLVSVAVKAEVAPLDVNEESFKCMLDMTPVRDFYVDNLNAADLPATLAVAEQGQGEYPAGSIVQLVPGEVMVKHPKGHSPVTKDWEFFELKVSPEGTNIHKRGYADVVNQFGGNCLGCHIQAKPEFDMICEKGHGCAPIPLPTAAAKVLQKTDPRCGGRYTPTPEDMAILKQLRSALSANK